MRCFFFFFLRCERVGKDSTCCALHSLGKHDCLIRLMNRGNRASMTDPPPVPPARFGLLSLPQDPIFDILSQSAIGCRELCQLEGSCTTIRQMIAGARPRDIAEVRGKRSVQVLYKCRHSIPSLLPMLLPDIPTCFLGSYPTLL